MFSGKSFEPSGWGVLRNIFLLSLLLVTLTIPVSFSISVAQVETERRIFCVSRWGGYSYDRQPD
jgi:hypothetical protein